jgi:hypothetical protein
MKLPIQAQAIMRNVTTAKMISTGIVTSVWNRCNCNSACRISRDACVDCLTGCLG